MFFKVVLENKVCCSPSLVYRAVNMNGIPCPTGTSLCPMRDGASLLHALHFCLLQFMPCPTEWFSCDMYSLTPESNELLCWELSYLGLKLIKSQFVDGGFGLATNENTSFSPADLICQYFGRFLVLTQAETDQLFHPLFFGNHERLVLLTSVMQPIVHEHQTVPDSYDQVIFLVLKLYMQRCS